MKRSQLYSPSAKPTCDTSIYADGDLIGGKLTFTNCFSGDIGTGTLISVIMHDESKQAGPFDVVLFCDNPVGTTFTDQAALDIADSDLGKIIAVVNIATTAQFSFNDNSVHVVQSIAIPLRGLTGWISTPTPFGTLGGTTTSTLYGALVSRGTPTFAAATDVQIILNIYGD